MTPEAIRELVYLSYQAYEHGERSFLTDLLHDNVQFIMHCPPEALPVPNRICGKAALLAAFKKIDEVVIVERTELQLVIVENDWASVICDRTLRQRASGRVMRYKVAAFQRYSNARLIEYHGFTDSVDLMEQAIGRELDLPNAFPSAGTG